MNTPQKLSQRQDVYVALECLEFTKWVSALYALLLIPEIPADLEAAIRAEMDRLNREG